MVKFILSTLLSFVGLHAEPPKVTVFVHGTDLIPKTLIKPLERLIRHKPGMFALKESKLQYKYAKYLNSLCKHNPETFPKKDAHLFCWSGKLSHKARVKAAQDLHKELNTLSLKYKKRIHLSVVTHSHGGNVVLNLARIKEKREYTINKLVLLAVPVQEETKHCVTAECFKSTTIYSAYSTGDMVQILDPQGLKHHTREYRRIFCKSATKKRKKTKKKKIPLFSQRTFCHKHVHHIKVKNGKRSIAHIEFLLPPFTKMLTTLLKNAAQHDFSKDILKFKY